MRAHSSGRVTSFVTEREIECSGVRSYILQGVRSYILQVNDVSEAVRTTLALDISMSKPCTIVLTSAQMSAGYNFTVHHMKKSQMLIAWTKFGLNAAKDSSPYFSLKKTDACPIQKPSSFGFVKV
jgi:hypothetical protein